MNLPGGNKDERTCLDWMTPLPVKKPSLASNDKIDLISGVRLL